MLLGTFAGAGFIFLGSVVVSATGTLPGGWGGVWLEIGLVLAAGIAFAVGLILFASRKPKPLAEK